MHLLKRDPKHSHTRRHHHCWSTVSLFDKEGVSVNICGEWNTCPTHGWQCNGNKKKLSLYCVPSHNLLFNKLTVLKLSRYALVPFVATRCQCWVVEELQSCPVGSVFSHTGVRCVNHTLLLTLWLSYCLTCKFIVYLSCRFTDFFAFDLGGFTDGFDISKCLLSCMIIAWKCAFLGFKIPHDSCTFQQDWLWWACCSLLISSCLLCIQPYI